MAGRLLFAKKRENGGKGDLKEYFGYKKSADFVCSTYHSKF